MLGILPKILFFVLLVAFGFYARSHQLKTHSSFLAACPQGQKRAPSSDICVRRLSEESKIPDELKVISHLRQDRSHGVGLDSASLYMSDGRVLEPASTEKPAGQVVAFHGTAVQGTPTRVYFGPQGEIAYIAFDGQPITLLDSSGPIRGQGPTQHPSGFSSPVGKLKNLPNPLSEYSVEKLRELVGSEGSEAKLEFESGVVVEGTIEKYTSSNASSGQTATVITFKSGTCTVTFGKTKLYKPAWGTFDMLLMSQLTDSNSHLQTK